MDTFETKTFRQSLLQQLRHTQNVATHNHMYTLKSAPIIELQTCPLLTNNCLGAW